MQTTETLDVLQPEDPWIRIIGIQMIILFTQMTYLLHPDGSFSSTLVIRWIIELLDFILIHKEIFGENMFHRVHSFSFSNRLPR